MELTLTHRQGNQLLQYLGVGPTFPEKLGKQEFSAPERAFANDEMRKARQVLLSYSESWAKKRKVLFGKAENWRCKDEARDAWALIDLELPIKVKLSDEEERGIFWILVLMAHPASPAPTGIEGLDDVVWPLSEAIGYRKELCDMTGLSERKLPRLPKKDSDPSWKKDSKKVELDEKPAAAPVEQAKVIAEEIAGKA